MGFFSDLAGAFGSAVGSADRTLLATGQLGRAEVTGVTASGMTLSVNNNLPERKCTFSLNVMLDHTPPFPATVVQRVQEVYIPQLSSGKAVVAVRVDPDDHSRVAIDFTTPVPEVTLPAGTGDQDAARVLASGTPITVVLVANAPIGIKNAAGDEVQALTLTVATGVQTPYQLQVNSPVPATALPLLYPGARLHAKLGSDPNAVVVDWAAGLVKD